MDQVVYQWNKGETPCPKCGDMMFDVADEAGVLVVGRCKSCGHLEESEEHRLQREQWQKECHDGIVGRKAREARERQEQRLQFSSEFDPYKNKIKPAVWVSPAERRRKRLTGFLVNLLIIVTTIGVILLTWQLMN